MELFRVFHWDGTSQGGEGGGPLFVPRIHQGAGRHDAPDRYAAWYATRQAVGAIAERIQHLRGQALTNADCRRMGRVSLAIVGLRLDTSLAVVDLDHPRQLIKRHLRPSRVATRRRRETQAIARRIFDEGAAGMSWWSTLDADWTNVTLFYERVVKHVAISTPPRKLTIEMPEVAEAADHLGVQISR
ncbi:MAG TPA: RES family NAD+ phosphorylase [Vicinamibacterales bacterium]|nr:RES family NAD+ phosphorylase [Vicinamibacterales bacterium]